jgi:hypothetical protein
MGLLEKLGLRDHPSAKLSEWLGGRLARLASETKSGEVETMQPLLSEIDERIAGFVRDHGAPALESAIDQWVDRTGLADVIAATRVLRFRQEMRETLRKPLEEVTGHGEMRDLDLESALERTGVLYAHLLYQDLPTVPDPENALPAIRDAVWPFGTADRALREGVATAANISTDDAGWHLLGLRCMLLQASVKARGGERSGELVGYVMSQIHHRLIGRPGFRGMARTEERLLEAATVYLKPITQPAQVDGVQTDPVFTTVAGRAFATLCGAPDKIEVRWLGAREVARLYPLLAAYAGAWFERN